MTTERIHVASPRARYAITHPMNRADGDITPYRATRIHATGLLIMTVLAVDR